MHPGVSEECEATVIYIVALSSPPLPDLPTLPQFAVSGSATHPLLASPPKLTKLKSFATLPMTGLPAEVDNGYVTDNDEVMCSRLCEYFLSGFTSENLEYRILLRQKPFMQANLTS